MGNYSLVLADWDGALAWPVLFDTLCCPYVLRAFEHTSRPFRTIRRQRQAVAGTQMIGTPCQLAKLARLQDYHQFANR